MHRKRFGGLFFLITLCFQPLLFGQGTHPVELGYDDGLAPNVQLTFLLNGGYRYVTRFTPPVVPAQLIRIRYYLADTTKGTGFYLHVMDDNYNAPKHEPSMDLIDSVRVEGGRLGWNDCDLVDRNIVVAKDFYVGLYYDLKSKLTLGAENREPISKRAYDSDCCSWWVREDVDLYIHAVLIIHSSVVGETDGRPEAAVLAVNYPNPFNHSTVVRYGIRESESIRLAVMDAFGREVKQLARGWHESGNHQVVWNGTDSGGNALPSGVYVCRLTCGKLVRQIKLLLIR